VWVCDVYEGYGRGLCGVRAEEKGGKQVSCVKKRYWSKVDAMSALARATRPGRKTESKRPKSEKRVYECSKCGGWHLTSK
jgi:hypothetical protein